MDRRKYLAMMGVIGGGSAAAMGTGAFTSASANRDVSVTVADDTNGYLGFSASPGENGEFASVDTSSGGDGEIALDFDASDGGGSGVGLNSTYNFDDVFRIENQGTQTIYVWANFSGEDLDDDDIWFYPGSDSDRELNDGDNSVVTLTTGQQVNVGVHIDTSALSSADDQALTATLTADVDVPNDSNPSDPGGGDAAVVSENPDEGEYSSIQNAIDAVDGTTVLVEPGTYNESISINKDGLSLVSTGNASQTEIQTDSGISVPASDVEISGFTIDLTSGADIYVGGGGNGLQFSNNDVLIAEDSSYGIRVEGPVDSGSGTDPDTGAVISDNEFVQSSVASGSTPQGILLSDGSGFTVESNTFNGSDAGQAVLVTKQNTTTSTNINVSNNDIDGWSEGVRFFVTSGQELGAVSVDGNTVNNVSAGIQFDRLPDEVNGTDLSDVPGTVSELKPKSGRAASILAEDNPSGLPVVVENANGPDTTIDGDDDATVTLDGNGQYYKGLGFGSQWSVTGEKAAIGDGSWQTETTEAPEQKQGIYFAGKGFEEGTADFGILPDYTVDDIEAVSYELSEPSELNGVDIYLNIYTVAENDGGDSGFYDSRLQALPVEANGGNPNFTPGEWNTFSTTETANNTLHWADTGRGGTNFSGTLPTLSEIQDGAVEWDEYGSGFDGTHDYRDETVLALSLQTGSGSSPDLEAYIDNVQVKLTSGEELQFDLEP